MNLIFVIAGFSATRRQGLKHATEPFLPASQVLADGFSAAVHCGGNRFVRFHLKKSHHQRGRLVLRQLRNRSHDELNRLSLDRVFDWVEACGRKAIFEWTDIAFDAIALPSTKLIDRRVGTNLENERLGNGVAFNPQPLLPGSRQCILERIFGILRMA